MTSKISQTNLYTLAQKKLENLDTRETSAQGPVRAFWTALAANEANTVQSAITAMNESESILLPFFLFTGLTSSNPYLPEIIKSRFLQYYARNNVADFFKLLYKGGPLLSSSIREIRAQLGLGKGDFLPTDRTERKTLWTPPFDSAGLDEHICSLVSLVRSEQSNGNLVFYVSEWLARLQCPQADAANLFCLQKFNNVIAAYFNGSTGYYGLVGILTSISNLRNSRTTSSMLQSYAERICSTRESGAVAALLLDESAEADYAISEFCNFLADVDSAFSSLEYGESVRQGLSILRLYENCPKEYEASIKNVLTNITYNSRTGQELRRCVTVIAGLSSKSISIRNDIASSLNRYRLAKNCSLMELIRFVINGQASSSIDRLFRLVCDEALVTFDLSDKEEADINTSEEDSISEAEYKIAGHILEILASSPQKQLEDEVVTLLIEQYPELLPLVISKALVRDYSPNSQSAEALAEALFKDYSDECELAVILGLCQNQLGFASAAKKYRLDGCISQLTGELANENSTVLPKVRRDLFKLTKRFERFANNVESDYCRALTWAISNLSSDSANIAVSKLRELRGEQRDLHALRLMLECDSVNSRKSILSWMRDDTLEASIASMLVLVELNAQSRQTLMTSKLLRASNSQVGLLLDHLAKLDFGAIESLNTEMASIRNQLQLHIEYPIVDTLPPLLSLDWCRTPHHTEQEEQLPRYLMDEVVEAQVLLNLLCSSKSDLQQYAIDQIEQYRGRKRVELSFAAFLLQDSKKKQLAEWLLNRSGNIPDFVALHCLLSSNSNLTRLGQEYIRRSSLEYPTQSLLAAMLDREHGPKLAENLTNSLTVTVERLEYLSSAKKQSADLLARLVVQGSEPMAIGAISLMQNINRSVAREALLKSFKEHPSPKVRVAAASVLFESNWVADKELLESIKGDTCDEVRGFRVQLLDKNRNLAKEEISFLVTALIDSSHTVSDTAARVIESLMAMDDVRSELGVELESFASKAPQQARERILTILKSTGWEVIDMSVFVRPGEIVSKDKDGDISLHTRKEPVRYREVKGSRLRDIGIVGGLGWIIFLLLL